MFEENRLTYFETPSVEVVAQMTAPQGEFGNLHELLTKLHGETKARQELANIAARTTAECQKVGATSMDQVELVERVRQIARKELESARKSVLARLGEEARDVANLARSGASAEAAAESTALPVQVGNRMVKVGELVPGVEYSGWQVYLRWDPRIGYCLAPSDYLPVSDHYIPLGNQPGKAIEKLAQQQAPALARQAAAARAEAALNSQIDKAMSQFNTATEEVLAAEEARLTPRVRQILNSNPSMRQHFRTNDVVRDILNGMRSRVTNAYMEARTTKDVARIAEAQKRTVDAIRGWGDKGLRGFFRTYGVSLPEEVGAVAATPRPTSVPEAAAEATVGRALKVGNRTIKVGDMVDDTYRLICIENNYFLQNVKIKSAPVMGLGDASAAESALARSASVTGGAAPVAAPEPPAAVPKPAPAPEAPSVVRPLPKAPQGARIIVGPDNRYYASGRGFPLQEVQNPFPEPPVAVPKPAAVPEAPVAPRVSPYANASEAEVMAALARGEKIVEAQDLARLGWSIKTGIQNGRALNILVKGERILQVGGKALTIAGKVLVPLGIALECLVIGSDIYTMHGILKNEAVNVRAWKRANNMPNPDSVSASDLVAFTEAGRSAAFDNSARLNREEYEAAEKKLTFLDKAHAALVFAKGILHDVRILESTLSQHNVSGWDVLNPGKLLGEALATADARNQEFSRKADEFRNGAARCRALVGQLNGMEHKLPHTKDVVTTVLQNTAILADNVANAAEHGSVLRAANNPDPIMNQANAAQRLVEADIGIAREEKRKNQPRPSAQPRA